MAIRDEIHRQTMLDQAPLGYSDLCFQLTGLGKFLSDDKEYTAYRMEVGESNGTAEPLT